MSLSPPSPPSNTPRPQRRGLKRRRRSVEFSSAVGQRSYADNSPQPSTSWLSNEEVENLKRRAKTLSKLHYQMRKGQTVAQDPAAGLVEATRYKIKGESLRGMEHITDSVNGRKRQRVQDEAIQATVIEQKAQLIQHVLDSSTPCQAVKQAVKMDHSKLAKVYRSKTREALAYAEQVAKEDAKVAAKILAEDLRPQSSLPLRKRRITMDDAHDPNGASRIIKRMMPRRFSRQRCIASMQA